MIVWAVLLGLVLSTVRAQEGRERPGVAGAAWSGQPAEPKEEAADELALDVPLLPIPQEFGEDRIRFNGFADITLGTDFGDPASGRQRALFEQFGGYEQPLNSYGKGFGIVGADFVVTADLTEDLVFQGEINFQTDRGGSEEIEIDTERFFLDYRHSELINLQAGLFFTPIGYHNRFLYSRSWLMHSVFVPDLFEEELNLVPTHTVGANLHGQFDVGEQRFKYAVGIGNGRAIDPTINTFARDDKGKEVTWLLEWLVPGAADFRVGLSGWYSEIHTFEVGAIGNTVDINSATPLRLDEVGFNPYVTYMGEDFNLLAEAAYGKIGGEALFGLTAELSLNLADNHLHPYVRYDHLDLPSGDQGSYYGLRLDGDLLTKTFIPETRVGIVGVNYDVNPNTRLKVEFARHFEGAHDEHSLVTQIAFGF